MEQHKVLTNWVKDEWVDKETNKKCEEDRGLSCIMIHRRLKMYLDGDWPKAVGKTIYGLWGDDLREIGSHNTLFAWINENGITTLWRNKGVTDGVSKAVFFEYLRNVSPRHNSVEMMPHYPLAPNSYYHLPYKPSLNYIGSLGKVLRMLSPATGNDAIYLKALFMTGTYGGPGGSRPAFVLLGEEDDQEGGRGVGKTAITDLLGILYGPCIDFVSEEKRETISKRLLTASSKRIVRVDNVRGKMASESFESIITSQHISGHKMYAGDDSLPNYFTYVITFNSPEFSKDMSQRAIPIRLKRPRRNPKWWQQISQFCTERRWDILWDIHRTLKGKALCELNDHNRFAQWSDSVLNRCTDNADITTDITERQIMIEDEVPLVDQYYEVLSDQLSRYTFGPGRGIHADLDRNCYRVKRALFVSWIKSEIENMSPNMIFKNLHRDPPNWLIRQMSSSQNKPANSTDLNKDITVCYQGTRFLEFGCKKSRSAWIIEKHHAQSSRVTNIVKRSNVAIVKNDERMYS